MRTQIEVKFLKVDINETRQRLEKIMANLLEPMRRVRTAVIDDKHNTAIRENRWIRLRDFGNKTILTHKEDLIGQQGATKLTELTIDSFESAIELLEKLGLHVKSIQQLRREIWQLGEVRLALDQWPWIKPYMKIVGPSEAAVRDVSARLGFAWSQAIFGGTTLAYAAQYPGIKLELGENITHIPEIKFGEPLPDWLKERQAL